MPFSAGTYTLPNPALVTGEIVSASENNSTRNDMASAFNLTMLRNGTSTATANLPMGGYKLTGLGVATTSGDALSYGQAVVVTTLTSTSLTATRVPYAGTGGLLQDASTFTFDGTTLTAGGFTTSGAISAGTISASGNITVSGGTANGVAYLNGSKVLTTGSALTLDASGNLLVGGTSTTPFSGTTGLGVTRATTPAIYLSQTQNTGGYTAKDYVNYVTANGALAWYDTTASSERMRIDSSGNVGIGTSSPGYCFDAQNNASAITCRIKNSNSTSKSGIQFDNYVSTASGSVYYDNTNAAFVLGGDVGVPTVFTSTGSERMRIDSSGNLLVGTTTSGLPGVVGTTVLTVDAKNAYNGIAVGNIPSGGYSAYSTRPSGNFYYYAGLFANSSNNSVGNIYCDTTSTSYNTSSDYRLKENIQPMQNALGVVAQLNPVTYTWKTDGSDGQGFIAHELQAVVPDCVTGEKDAVDDEGKPVYQGIDTSFLSATLTKALQELHEIVKSQAAEIAELKAKLA